jgi:hypothetical protein
MMNPNRGVTAMLPTQHEEEKTFYDFKLGFTLFKKEFSFTFKVNSKKE